MTDIEYRDWAIKRMRYFVDKTAEATNPMEMEAMFFVVEELAGRTKREFHKRHDPDGLPF